MRHAGGAVQYDFVESNGTTADVSNYIINERGVISVVEPPADGTATTLHIEIKNGDESEIVSVAVTLAPAPTLSVPVGAESAMIAENAVSTTPLITGITTTVTNPSWVIREATPTSFVSQFNIVENTANFGTYNLLLKAGQSLDHEAFSDGVVNLLVWAEDSNGVRSNALKLTITVTDVNDAPVFLVFTSSNGLTDGREDVVEDAELGWKLRGLGRLMLIWIL